MVLEALLLRRQLAPALVLGHLHLPLPGAGAGGRRHLVVVVSRVSTLMLRELQREEAGTNMCCPVLVPQITGGGDGGDCGVVVVVVMVVKVVSDGGGGYWEGSCPPGWSPPGCRSGSRRSSPRPPG